MEQYVCGVSSAGEQINFYSNIKLCHYFNEEGFSRNFLELKFSPEALGSDYNVFYNSVGFNCFVYLEKELRINRPWKEMFNGQTLIYAAYPLFELQRNLDGYVTIKSAAVDFNGKSVLLFGRQGAGKTSIAIDLGRRYGANLVGNDLTIMGLKDGKLKLKGGTKFFALRHESVKRNLPDLLHLFPHSDESESWTYKIRVNPEDLNIATKVRSTVDKIFMVHVDETKKDVFVRNEESISSRVYLSENFASFIRATSFAALGSENSEYLGYIPSYDHPKLFEMRMEIVKRVQKDMLYISGPLSAISDYIANAINKG